MMADVDNARIEEYFKESKRIPFDSLPTVLITGRASLEKGTNIDAKVIFDNIPIFTIEGWERGNNVKVKIPHPGIPFTVLSAKYGNEIRGIVKNLNDLKKKAKGNEGKFPNQVSLDVALKDKVVNIFIFKDSIKIAGAQKAEHLVEAFVFIKSVLMMFHNRGMKVFDQSPVLVKLDIDMLNVAFDLGFTIRRDVLAQKAIEHGALSPPLKESVQILYPMGYEKAKGGERYYTFKVLHTGKVMFSGDGRQSMKPQYDKFMDFISAVESDIRFY